MRSLVLLAVFTIASCAANVDVDGDEVTAVRSELDVLRAVGVDSLGRIWRGVGTGENASNWAAVNGTSGFVDVSAASDGRLYAVKNVANSGRIFRSTDAGLTWQQTNASGFSKVGASWHEIYAVGASSGDVWSALSGVLNPEWMNVAASGFRDISNSQFYVWSVKTWGSIYYSSNYGGSWTYAEATGFQSIDVNEQFIYATGTNNGDIWRSTHTNPLSWTKTGANGFRTVSVGADGQVWAVGTGVGDLWFSNTNGSTWHNTGVTGLVAVDAI